ncbi:MAG: hypothetical protein ACE5LV_02310 [Candidatus Aminicenantales bacterium]
MKRLEVAGLVVLIVLAGLVSCQKKAAAPEAGTAKAQDILALLPSDAQGVLFIDVHAAMTTEIAKKAIQENKDYQKYQEFVQMTGLDPQKDIYYAAIAVMSAGEGMKTEGVGVINMKYDKDNLLGLIKAKAEEEGQPITEETYENFTVYNVQQEEEAGSFVFVEGSNVIVGNPGPVKSVLDVLNKKRDNIFKNAQISDLIERANKDAMFWGAVLLPPEAMEKAAGANPMLSALKDITAVSMYFDYKQNNVIGEIMAISTDPENNKKVADALAGMKSFAGMAAAEKPEIGELLNKIEISSGEDFVKIHAEIPEDLIKKLEALSAAETQEKQ